MDNLGLMMDRLNWMGGTQEQRIIKDKYKAFKNALENSYQASHVIKINDTKHLPYHCLINPDRVQLNYDYKILSIDKKYNFQVGDIFEWVGTDTYWLIYLQELTEKAYFRGKICKCQYKIHWIDEEGHSCYSYAAIDTSLEKNLDITIKNDIVFNNPNYSLQLMLPKNEETLKFFKRYTKFYLSDGVNNICWRIVAVDSFNMANIIKCTAQEYYTNEDTDITLSDGSVIPYSPEAEKIERDSQMDDSAIIGNTFIKPHIKEIYYFAGTPGGDAWSANVDSTMLNINTDIDPITIGSITYSAVEIEWKINFSGEFKLSYGNTEKTIVVESLF